MCPERRTLKAPARPAGGFTLVELLVVIGVLVLLVAILIVAVARSREYAVDAQCKSNLRQLWEVLHGGEGVALPEAVSWIYFVRENSAGSILTCPKDHDTSKLTTTGDVVAVAPPPSVQLDVTGDKIWAFPEKQGIVLPADLAVSASAPGTYAAGASGAPVPAGTLVDSFFLHNHSGRGIGGVSFTARILGVLFDASRLYASEGLLGRPGTSYPYLAGGWDNFERGFEANQPDNIVLHADMHSLTINMGSGGSWVDQVRVVTAPGGGLNYSYGMNDRLGLSPPPDRIVLVEYQMFIVSPDAPSELFDRNLAPRHLGKANAVFSHGGVRGLPPEDLCPQTHPELWGL